MYKTIYNSPRERELTTYSWVYWDEAFTSEELDKIVSYCQERGTEASSILGTTDLKDTERVRVSSVRFHHRDENTSWIFDRLNDIIVRLNERFYGFNLNGYDSFQYTEYDSSKLGKYDWHMDTQMGVNTLGATRKLSLILNLTEQGKDYEGGNFNLNVGMEEEPEYVPIPRGRVIAFPSWMIHRVTPVTQGVRRSIVVWVTGPKFV